MNTKNARSSSQNTNTPPSHSPFKFSYIPTWPGFFQDHSRYTPIPTASQSSQLIDCITPLTERTGASNTPYNILSKNSEGQWEIIKAEDPDIQVVPIGAFDYVVMPNGEIRVQNCSPQQQNSHSQLADGTPVRSAGQLFFSEEGTLELEWWNNHSIDYPSETVDENIGLTLADFEKLVSNDDDSDNLEVAQAFESYQGDFY